MAVPSPTPPWARPAPGLDAYYTGAADGYTPWLWLGTHEPHWLGRTTPAGEAIPWMVSRRRLERLRPRSWPEARTWWVMDSGAFTEASLHGRWTIDVATYAAFCVAAAERIGHLAWVAPMDLCCEPAVVERVRREGWLADQVRLPARCPDDPAFAHLVWTVRNYVELRDALDGTGVHVIPVVQGWTLDHYAWSLELYEMAGVDLSGEALVGIGSTCRRDADASILAKIAWLAEAGLERIHAFGVKGTAATLAAHRVSSTDSLAWSYWARRRGRTIADGCTHQHCGNCIHAAVAWRDRFRTRTDTSLEAWRAGCAAFAATHVTAPGEAPNPLI